ncbi:MAG TPA: YtxH domain-containing protein [Roseiflexaceae bacterium]|nr:YtxH domain-containing protein [Roseiflexaceae bacterium]
MEKQNSDLMFLAGLVAGAIVGGAAAALLAPRSGPETREQIVERGLELKNRAEDVVERAQRVAGDTVAKVQTAAQDMIGQTPDAATETGAGDGI